MFALIVALLSSIMKSVVNPVLNLIGKAKDDKLAGAQSAMVADTAENAARLQYDVQVQNLKVQSNANWEHMVAYSIIAWSAAVHVAMVNVCSTVSCPFVIQKLPSPYDNFEFMVVSSLFVTTIAGGTINNLSTWLAGKVVQRK